MPAKKRALRIPSKVKIGYSTFTIERKDSDWKDKNKAVGMCRVESSLIEYCSEQSDAEVVNTILHEILHAIVYIFDIEFDNAKKEECLVTKMANGIQTLLYDNPELLIWITESCKKNR